jgi:hypothetical protein
MFLSGHRLSSRAFRQNVSKNEPIISAKIADPSSRPFDCPNTNSVFQFSDYFCYEHNTLFLPSIFIQYNNHLQISGLLTCSDLPVRRIDPIISLMTGLSLSLSLLFLYGCSQTASEEVLLGGVCPVLNIFRCGLIFMRLFVSSPILRHSSQKSHFTGFCLFVLDITK